MRRGSNTTDESGLLPEEQALFIEFQEYVRSIYLEATKGVLDTVRKGVDETRESIKRLSQEITRQQTSFTENMRGVLSRFDGAVGTYEKGLRSETTSIVRQVGSAVEDWQQRVDGSCVQLTQTVESSRENYADLFAPAITRFDELTAKTAEELNISASGAIDALSTNALTCSDTITKVAKRIPDILQDASKKLSEELAQLTEESVRQLASDNSENAKILFNELGALTENIKSVVNESREKYRDLFSPAVDQFALEASDAIRNGLEESQQLVLEFRAEQEHLQAEFLRNYNERAESTIKHLNVVLSDLKSSFSENAKKSDQNTQSILDNSLETSKQLETSFTNQLEEKTTQLLYGAELAQKTMSQAVSTYAEETKNLTKKGFESLGKHVSNEVASLRNNSQTRHKQLLTLFGEQAKELRLMFERQSSQIATISPDIKTQLFELEDTFRPELKKANLRSTAALTVAILNSIILLIILFFVLRGAL